jgi:hypothetical protein
MYLAFLTSLLPDSSSPEDYAPLSPLISLGRSAVFFGVQGLLVFRMARKSYRSFRVVAFDRRGGRHALSLPQLVRVWLWILIPQLIFSILATTALFWYSSHAPAQTVRGLAAFQSLIEFFLVGPCAVGLALRARYSDFTLRVYGYRYI